MQGGKQKARKDVALETVKSWHSELGCSSPIGLHRLPAVGGDHA